MGGGRPKIVPVRANATTWIHLRRYTARTARSQGTRTRRKRPAVTPPRLRTIANSPATLALNGSLRSEYFSSNRDESAPYLELTLFFAMHLSDEALRNRAAWDHASDEYQSRHASQLNSYACAWGTWNIPEDDLHALGD